MSDPLTEEHLSQLNTSLEELKRLEGILAKAASAGLDVTVQTEQAKGQKAQILKIKGAFFPGQ